MAYSSTLQNFLNDFLVTGTDHTYTIDNFTIVYNGVIFDGGSAPDVLKGSATSDIIWGNGGADVLRGGDARDLITGGAGSDDLYGENGDDRLQGWGHNDELFGAKGDDALYGGEGDDKLFGGEGDDYLCAGSSHDELYGGSGADIFVFRPDLDAAKSESVYYDFKPGTDELRIEDYLLPNGLSEKMIKVDADGDLCINTNGGHRLTFENLDRGDIGALYDSISLI